MLHRVIFFVRFGFFALNCSARGNDVRRVSGRRAALQSEVAAALGCHAVGKAVVVDQGQLDRRCSRAVFMACQVAGARQEIAVNGWCESTTLAVTHFTDCGMQIANASLTNMRWLYRSR